MASGEAEATEEGNNTMAGWGEGKVEDQWRRTKEHAEACSYVWASYIVVCDGFGAYFAYRWRKLRRTEDRVRILQRRLRDLVESDEQSAATAESPPLLMENPALPNSRQVISPVKVVYVVVVNELLAVQNESFERPTNLVVENVRGGGNISWHGCCTDT